MGTLRPRSLTMALRRWDECEGYRDVFGDLVFVIEYRPGDFRKTCREHGTELSVVLRDRDVTTSRSRTYRFRAC